MSHSSPAQLQAYLLLEHFHVKDTEIKTVIIHCSNTFSLKYWVLDTMGNFLPLKLRYLSTVFSTSDPFILLETIHHLEV